MVNDGTTFYPSGLYELHQPATVIAAQRDDAYTHLYLPIISAGDDSSDAGVTVQSGAVAQTLVITKYYYFNGQRIAFADRCRLYGLLGKRLRFDG